MTVIQHTYNVHDKNGFLHNLNKIVKRYKVQVDVVWGEPVTYKTWVQTPHGDIKITVTKHPVTVDFSFDQFRVEGFTYLGCIKDENMMGLITIHGNEVLGTDGTGLTEFVSQFEDIPCHNCGRKHRRKIGHVFRVNETGEFIIFGSACAKNYFGINFDRILKFFERINITFTDGWDNEYLRGLWSNIIDWRSAAKYAYYIISKDGYLSGAKAREQERNSTGDWVREMMNDNDDVITDAVRRELREMRENNQFPDFDELHTTDFVGKTEGLNDFEHNLTVLQEKMRQNCVTFHQYGWIAYLVFKKWFWTDNRPQRKEYIIPDWMTEGRRVKKGEAETPCTITGIHFFNGSYGPCHLYTFECNDVRFKWFSSNDQNVEVGDEIILNGYSIKKLEDDPKYGKSIIINRARFEKTDGSTTRPQAQRTQRVHVSQEDRDYFSRIGVDDI